MFRWLPGFVCLKWFAKEVADNGVRSNRHNEPGVAELLADYERPGLIGPAFARMAHVNYPAFAWWRRHYEHRLHRLRMPPWR